MQKLENYQKNRFARVCRHILARTCGIFTIPVMMVNFKIPLLFGWKFSNEYAISQRKKIIFWIEDGLNKWIYRLRVSDLSNYRQIKKTNCLYYPNDEEQEKYKLQDFFIQFYLGMVKMLKLLKKMALSPSKPE